MTSVLGNSSSEIDRLDPEATIRDLVSGIQVRVLRLKMRQLFKLLRIITRGGAAYLPMLRDALVMSGDDEAAEVFGTQLMAIAMIALPEAENEAVEFIQSVVDVVNLYPGKDKQAREINAEKRGALLAELDNPELEDVLTIIQAVVDQERDDLVALGKRLLAMFKVAAKTEPDLVKTLQSIEPTPDSQEPLPVPVISSPPSTDGPTTPSSNSPSAG